MLAFQFNASIVLGITPLIKLTKNGLETANAIHGHQLGLSISQSPELIPSMDLTVNEK